MIRSLAVAFVTIAVVASFGLKDHLAAQQPAAGATGPGAVPIQFSGGTPGVNLELFINAGKVADVTINSSGQGASVLDLSNLGKVQMQVYVDVCQDGKTVRVLVVSGQPPPEDNCKRRIAGAAWWSDCGVTRITLDLTKFGTRIIGCGSFMSENRNWLIPVGAGAVAIPFIAGGGGDSTSVSTPITTTSTTTTTTTTTTTQPTVPVVPPTTPTNTTVPAPTVTATGTYRCVACSIRSDVSNHNPTLRVCDVLTNTFNVVEGSLTIRHPSPFIDVTGTNYNTTSGAFDISGTGTVAGFSNVAARAVGTVTNSTGRIVFDYTLGSNGVFPGGQPITYSVTLQKQ